MTPPRAGGTTAVILLAAAFGPGAAAQTFPAGPPGPYVVDLRGVTAGLPTGADWYREGHAGLIVPSRGFGLAAGVHIYPAAAGPSRIGLGLDGFALRGSARSEDGRPVRAVAAAMAPQMSLNFGTSAGWSYLSGGLGALLIRTEVGPGGRAGGEWRRAVNIGGGARWFVSPRVAVGFDVRFHRAGSSDRAPGARLLAAAVGLSLR